LSSRWAALGLALVRTAGVCPPLDLVQRLKAARRDLELEAAINKLNKYQLLILDDIAYVTRTRPRTSVLFELIAVVMNADPCDHGQPARSVNGARSSPTIQWTLEAIDRLVHTPRSWR